jgi:hypothetical protein
MPADLHDANQLPAVLVTQATPWNYISPGVLCSSQSVLATIGGTVGSAYIASAVGVQQGGATFQLNTQDNTGPGVGPIQVQVTQLTTVAYTQSEAGLFKPVNGILRS